jgi:tripartite motif-containing protein 71
VYAPNGTLLSRWGTRGFELGQLRNPSAIAITPGGTIFLADHALDRIYKLSSTWQLLDVWGGSGYGPGRLNQPNDLVVDAVGDVYVADRSNNRVQKFGPGGDILATWQGTRAGSDLTVGWTVAVDERGRVYTHGNGARMLRLRPDNSPDLEIVAPGQGRFAGITIDAAGQLWALDSQAGNLWKLDQDGQVLAAWGAVNVRDPDFQQPNSVSVDRYGRVYVADNPSSPRVWRFTPETAP